MSASKGRQGEKEMRGRWNEFGFVSMTVPGSYNTENDFDDTVQANGMFGMLFAVECKRLSNSRYYIECEQLDELCRFSRQFHADCVPVVAVRWDYDTTWYVQRVSEIPRTKQNSNGVLDPETVKAEWPSMEEFIEQEIDA